MLFPSPPPWRQTREADDRALVLKEIIVKDVIVDFCNMEFKQRGAEGNTKEGGKERGHV